VELTRGSPRLVTDDGRTLFVRDPMRRSTASAVPTFVEAQQGSASPLAGESPAAPQCSDYPVEWVNAIFRTCWARRDAWRGTGARDPGRRPTRWLGVTAEICR
jgi:hypothetical protein